MEDIRYNNQIRKKMKSEYDSLQKCGYSDDVIKKGLTGTLKFWKESGDFLNLYLRLSIWFCDYYTVLNYRRNENTMSLQEQQDYEKISHLINFEEVLALWKQDYSLLTRTFEASLEFSQYSILGKISVFKNLKKEDNCYLNSICPNHQEDLGMYGGWVEPNVYILYYRKEFRACKNDWENRKQDIVIPNISGFLHNLAKLDYFNYEENAMYMISSDYLWSCYWVEHIENDIEREKRILFVEQNEPETWGKEFLYNFSYMNSILMSYLDQKIGNEIQDVTEEVAESYLQEVKPKGYAKIKEFLY